MTFKSLKDVFWGQMKTPVSQSSDSWGIRTGKIEKVRSQKLRHRYLWSFPFHGKVYRVFCSSLQFTEKNWPTSGLPVFAIWATTLLCEPYAKQYRRYSRLNNCHPDNSPWTTATLTNSTQDNGICPESHPGQLPPQITASQDNCHLGQFPPRTTATRRLVHGTYLSVPFPSHSNLCLSHLIPSHGTFPMGFPQADAQPGGGIWGICSPRNFQNIAQQF